MADKAASEEMLGEEAPAGIQTWGPESKGMPERGWDEDITRKGTRPQIEGAATVVPETGVETAPSSGTGGEPEVGGTIRDTDVSNPA
ncbi:MAG: hypothetical protein ACYC27_08830 [Armatimonadota bacterium]